MNPKIEELTKAKDVNGLMEMLWSRDCRDAASALERIDDPAVVDPLIGFLRRRSEFMQWDMKRYEELWSDNPGMIDYRDAALADFQSVQFPAIRMFEKLGAGKSTSKTCRASAGHRLRLARQAR